MIGSIWIPATLTKKGECPGGVPALGPDTQLIQHDGHNLPGSHSLHCGFLADGQDVKQIALLYGRVSFKLTLVMTATKTCEAEQAQALPNHQ